MNKITQTIALTIFVCLPLSLISLMTSATAHHTPSHVSTVSVKTNLDRKKKRVKKIRSSNSTKPRTTGSVKKKSAPTDTTTTTPDTGMPPEGTTPPIKLPTKTPPTSAPTSKIKPIDPMMGNPAKAGTNTKLPPANPGIPNIPLSTPGNVPNPAGNTPSIPRPNLPNIPAGTTKP